MPLHTERFTVGSTEVEVTVRKIKRNDLLYLENDFAAAYYSPGTGREGAEVNVAGAKNRVLTWGTEALKVAGREVKLDPAMAMQNVPEMPGGREDTDFDVYLDDAWLAAVVKHNPVLSKKEPASNIFGRYAPDSFPLQIEREGLPIKGAIAEAAEHQPDYPTASPHPEQSVPSAGERTGERQPEGDGLTKDVSSFSENPAGLQPR